MESFFGAAGVIFLLFFWFAATFLQSKDDNKVLLKSRSEVYGFKEFLEGSKYNASMIVRTQNTSSEDAVISKYVLIIKEGDILKKYPVVCPYPVNKKIQPNQILETDLNVKVDVDMNKSSLIRSQLSTRELAVHLRVPNSFPEDSVKTEEFNVYSNKDSDNYADIPVINEAEEPVPEDNYAYEYDEEVAAIEKEINDEETRRTIEKVMNSIIKR